MITDLHLAARSQNGTAWIWRPVGEGEIGVGKDDAKHQHQIGILDQPGNRRISGCAEIGAGDDVGSIFEKSASHEGGHQREIDFARQGSDFVLDVIAPDFDVDHRDRRGRPLRCA